MGNAIFRRLCGRKEVRVLFMGLDASGKTTSLYRLKLGEVVTTIPTIGFNVETVKVNNVHITAWDLGGRDKIRPLFRHYFQNTQGIVYMMDSSDLDRFEDAKEELARYLKEDELRDVPVLILANKQDLDHIMTPVEIRDRLSADVSPLGDRAWAVFGVSATDKSNHTTGLTEALSWLTDAMVTKETSHMVQQWLPGIQGTENGDKGQMEDENNNSYIESFKHTLKGMFHRIYLHN